ncbi:MAG: V-type ATP synthase subunit F [Anaerolineae bacterium]
MQLLVIGSPPAVWGFALAGVSGQIVETEDELTQVLDEALQRRDLGVILITGDVADLSRDRIEQLMARSEVPLIVEIPGPDSVAPGRPSIQDLLRKTIGVKV